jgi:hypothetical protein
MNKYETEYEVLETLSTVNGDRFSLAIKRVSDNEEFRLGNHVQVGSTTIGIGEFVESSCGLLLASHNKHILIPLSYASKVVNKQTGETKQV